MSLTIQQTVTVQTDGVIQITLPELRAGDSVEVTVVVKSQVEPTSPASDAQGWQRFAGIFKGAGAKGADNESIDADLADEYGNSLKDR